MSGTRTVQAGLEFLKEHVEKDSWFLQIECFDPHEPFYVPQKYRALYDLPEEETLNWPRYGRVASEDYREDLQNAAREYAALMTMCDVHLGLILDFMDAHDMWKDTVLIVNTDHGFLLGEHEWLGKNFPPPYDELVHLRSISMFRASPRADGVNNWQQQWISRQRCWNSLDVPRPRWARWTVGHCSRHWKGNRFGNGHCLVSMAAIRALQMVG